MTRLGALLWLKRRRVRMDQADTAVRMHVYIKQVRAWENGTCKPTKKELRRLAEIYRCDLEELLGNKLLPDIEAWWINDVLSAGEFPPEDYEDGMRRYGSCSTP